MTWLISSIAPLFYCNFDVAAFSYPTTVLLLFWVGSFLLLYHCYIGIIIWLFSSISTVSLQLLFGSFYLSSITPLFYINYDFPDVFYCTIVLLELWLGMFLLVHDYFIASIIWQISSIAPLFLLQLWFSWFLLLKHCFIGINIWLISSIPPLFHCYHEFLDFFYCTTVLLRLWFSWFYLLYEYLMAIIILLIVSTPPPFDCFYYLADFFYDTTLSLKLWFGWFLLLLHCSIASIIWLISSIAGLF